VGCFEDRLFLFVGISRQTENYLCVLCASVVNNHLFLATVWNDLNIGTIRAMIVNAMITPLIGLRKKMVQSF